MTAVRTPHTTEEEFSLFPLSTPRAADGWSVEEEGQLSVDVSETDASIIVTSAIAGVEPADLEVFLQNDMLTIRGRRHEDTESAKGRALVRECHWGAFSRSIILPEETRQDDVTAALTNGVLRVTLPKRSRPMKKIAIQ